MEEADKNIPGPASRAPGPSRSTVTRNVADYNGRQPQNVDFEHSFSQFRSFMIAELQQFKS